MNIWIEVFDREQVVGIIDTWQSLVVTENFYIPNQFNLIVSFSAEKLEMLKLGTYLLIDRKFYFIDNFFSDGLTIKVSGKGLAQYADRKIMTRKIARNLRPASIAAYLCNELVDFFEEKCGVLSSVVQDNIRYEKSYGNVLEEVVKLCETYDFGFFESNQTITKPNTFLVFSQGRDVSDLVEFSTNYENLMFEEFENHDFDFKNVAYVFGEGEGSDRKKIIINDHITGLDRRELYVDARDLQQEELTNAEYLELLKQRGMEKLSENEKRFSLNGQIGINNSLFEYGRDYYLGDLVTIKSEKFNLTRKQRLTSLTRTWDSTGYHIDPIFGKESPTIFEKLRR